MSADKMRDAFITAYRMWCYESHPDAHPEMVQSMAESHWGRAAGAMWQVATATQAAKTENDLFALLPGSYYMDLPDGGSVSVMEQLRRMAEDAARYRWAIAKEDNAEALYAAVLNNSPNIGDIEYEVDAAMNGRFA